VLPFAIQLGTRVLASARDDRILAMQSAQRPGEAVSRELSDLSPHAHAWTAYVEGAAWVLARQGVDLPGADVHVGGDLPVAAGLSSSAALTCAAIGSLLAVAGQTWDPQRVALAARRVENDYVGAPVGVMDPMVVMHAQQEHALFLDTRTLAVAQVPLRLREDGWSLLVVDTGSSHRTADAGYAERVAQCQEAARELGLDSLGDVTDPAEVGRLPDPVLRARARHVVTENARVRVAVDCLRDGRLDALGPLMNASHESLRDDFAVSTASLDLAVAAALAAGAAGARMTGAGFGGCVLALVAVDQVDRCRSVVAEALDAAGHRPPRVFEVFPSVGAHAVPAGQT
jgi:galactokinase